MPIDADHLVRPCGVVRRCCGGRACWAGLDGRWRRAGFLLAAVLMGVVPLAGCVASYEQQVQRVAKDWALTIRAAQVIPVYPLTEDIQPGDVFLVDRTANEQATLYNEKGFLPLDHLVARLDVGAYDDFYRAQYFTGDYATSAGHERLRRTPGQTIGSGGSGEAGGTGGSGSFAQRFNVPRAAFPTYSVEVRRGGGFQAAIPVQAIPVGLGLTGAESAVASVNLNDAYTYGADPDQLARTLREWAESAEGRRLIATLNDQRGEDEPLFLRVVQRVYLVGGVSVTVTNRATEGAGVDAGLAQQIGLLDAGDADALTRFTAARAAFAESINGSLASTAAPGASLRYAAASSRSVTLQEDFDRALSVGYLAHDYEIRRDGTIGVAVSTLDVLSGRARYPTTRAGGDEALGAHDFAIKQILAEAAEDHQEGRTADALAFVRRAIDGLPRAVDTARVRTLADEGKALDAVRVLSASIGRARASEGADGPLARAIFVALRDARTP